MQIMSNPSFDKLMGFTDKLDGGGTDLKESIRRILKEETDGVNTLIDVITSRCAPNFFRSFILLPFPFALKPYYLHYYISFNGCLSGNFRSLTILYKGYLTILEKFHDYLFRSIEIDSTSPSKL